VNPNPAALTLLAMNLDGQVAELRDEVADLEALVVWLARSYEYVDPATGETVHNEPIFGFSDLYGNDLPEGRRLAATWRRVVISGTDARKQTEPAGDARRPYQQKG